MKHDKDWINEVGYTWPYSWYTERLLGMDEVYTMVAWCEQHCKKEMMTSINNQVWYFQDEHDCLLFSLRWSDK